MFSILVLAHWQMYFGPTAHKSWQVVALQRWLQIAVRLEYKKHRETQNVVGNEK